MVFAGLLAACRSTLPFGTPPPQALVWGLQATRVSMLWYGLVKRSKNENTDYQ
jgi:hypothetical protein